MSPNDNGPFSVHRLANFFSSEAASMATSAAVGAAIGNSAVPLIGGAVGAVVGAGAERLSRRLHHILEQSSEVGDLPDPRRSNRFLSQVPLHLLSIYDKEINRPGRLLYMEEVDYVPRILEGRTPRITVSATQTQFQLSRFENQDVEDLRTLGFDAFQKSGKYRYPSTVIRINGISDDGLTTHLQIQPAQYRDQARSNLILDYAREGAENITIRKALRAERPGFLPDPFDTRLVQSLGITILVFYLDKGVLTPLLVPRTKEVAVMNEGLWSDTASGAAEWPEHPESTPETFAHYVLDDLAGELLDEVGLTFNVDNPDEGDVATVYPTALCRELIRAGKPQMFFVGFTKLDYPTLRKKMESARKKVWTDKSVPNEVNRMPLFRFPPKVRDMEFVESDMGQLGIDPQATASLHYALRLISGLEKSKLLLDA